MRGWRWLAPAVVVLLALVGWPLGRAIWLSLSTSRLTTPDDREFVGADNYVEVLTSSTWWFAVCVTLAIVVVAVLLQLVLALVFATALRRVTVLWPLTRVLVLVPFALLSVVTAIVWRDAVTTGFAAQWLDLDGGPLDALVGVSLGEVWRGTGIATVIVLAGLSRVSEAALVSAVADGATAWQRFRRVILPAAAPALAVAAAYRALDAFRTLEGPLLVDDRDSTWRTAPALLWDTSYSLFEIGLGAAMSVVLLVLAALLGVLLALVLRVRRVV
jgi:multiple sugar transport system permease protein